MSEICFWALRVVLDSADSAAVRNSDNHGHLHCTLGPVGEFCKLAGDLVEGWKNKTVELNLYHWAIATHGQSDCGSNNSRLCNWGIKYSALAKLFIEPLGYAENAT